MKLTRGPKLFGRFYLLDVVITLALLALILPMIHYYIRFNERGIAEQRLLERYIKQQTRYAVGFQTGPQMGSVDVLVSFKNISKEDLNKISLHDKEVLPDGTVMAQILWIGEKEPNYFVLDLGNNIYSRTVTDDLSYSLPARLRLKGIIQDGGLFNYKAKPLKGLSFFTFNSGHYNVDFVIELGPYNLDE